MKKIKINKIKKIAISFAIFAMVAVMAAVVYPTNNAQASVHGNVSRLGELIVLDNLFDNGSGGRGIGGASRLGEHPSPFIRWVDRRWGTMWIKALLTTLDEPSNQEERFTLGSTSPMVRSYPRLSEPIRS